MKFVTSSQAIAYLPPLRSPTVPASSAPKGYRPHVSTVVFGGVKPMMAGRQKRYVRPSPMAPSSSSPIRPRTTTPYSPLSSPSPTLWRRVITPLSLRERNGEAPWRWLAMGQSGCVECWQRGGWEPNASLFSDTTTNALNWHGALEPLTW